MAPAITKDKLDKLNPDMADDRNEGHNGKLTRNYQHVSHDLSTRTVEMNPADPPARIELFNLNRSFTLHLAQRHDFWFADSATYATHIDKANAEKGETEDLTRDSWIQIIKSDIRHLWDRLGDGQGLDTNERFEREFTFYHECRERLENLEKQGTGVDLEEFMWVVRVVLEKVDLKLVREDLVVLRDMAWEGEEEGRKEGKEGKEKDKEDNE